MPATQAIAGVDFARDLLHSGWVFDISSESDLWLCFWIIHFLIGLFLSGPNDHVFVYFTDHGAPNLIAFPESVVSWTKKENKLK